MIDAHVHVWTPGAHGCMWPTSDLPALHRSFDLDDFRAAGTESVARVMLVQSQEDARDTAWLLALAKREPLVAGVIGWTDLDAPDAPAAIAELAAAPRLRGLRPMVQDRAADWYDDPRLDAALAAMTRAKLVLDALVRPRHLASLARAARRHPALSIVVDHAGKPDFGDLVGWDEATRALADCPNVAVKLSGLLTELGPDHDPALIDRVVALLWEAFGPTRLIWGSDWPVLTLAGSYGGWLARARALVPAAAYPAVFGGNAARIYGVTQ